jgi:hypothetical protein
VLSGGGKVIRILKDVRAVVPIDEVESGNPLKDGQGHDDKQQAENENAFPVRKAWRFVALRNQRRLLGGSPIPCESVLAVRGPVGKPHRSMPDQDRASHVVFSRLPSLAKRRKGTRLLATPALYAESTTITRCPFIMLGLLFENRSS